MGVSRRAWIFGALGATATAGVASGGAYLAWYYGGEGSGRDLTPAEAHDRALAGNLLLIDIRRPDEWTATGVGEAAHPLDMRRDDFTEALLALAGGQPDAEIAVICARGVRSRHLSRQLDAAGLTRIYDVPEGMLGSAAGPGWLARGLPVGAWTATAEG